MFTLFKRKKTQLLTVDKLLAQDDVANTLSIIADKQPHIKTLIAIYVNDDDTYGHISTDDVTNADLLWYLELIKNDIFNPQDEED